MNTTIEELRQEYAKLLDPKEPLDSRMRELYRLKDTHLKTPCGIAVLLEAIESTDSVLLQHELAYTVGQSGLEEAVDPLARILSDTKYDEVTRHEAAESLGAIGSPKAIQVLEFYGDEKNEPNLAVRETCWLALCRITTRMKEGDEVMRPPADCPFVSVDPSHSFTDRVKTNDGKPVPRSVKELTDLLMDSSGATSLYVRYMAMFTLRNIGTSDAVQALCRALREDKSSALFRHEVAFVLGQLEKRESQGALIESLSDKREAAMVRHESAEALGAIADPKSLSVLQEFAKDEEKLVRDSCVVALLMHDYWSKFNTPHEGTASTA